MATQPTTNRLRFDEYLAIEETASIKSEFRSGEMFAVSGGTDVHARLASELIFRFRGQMPEDCRVFTSDLKVYIPSVNEGMYPDVMVICGPTEFYLERRDVVLNPTVVVEVLSPSTASYDTGLKTQFYRQIPNLRAILLVDSVKPYVQVQSRTENDGAWNLRETTNALEQVVVDRFRLTLGEIYGDILAG